jgi:DNA repair protein RadD
MLRDYQLRAIDELRAGFRAGHRRMLLVSPTGSGKTSVAAEMLRQSIERGHRALFIAHRKELISQAAERFRAEGIHCGIIMAREKEDRAAPLQIASIQTLARRPKPPARVICYDEAHHCAADSYLRTFAAYPDAWIVGLTATPFRTDGRGLKDLFDGVVVASTPSELIARGYLCSWGGYRYVVPNLDGIRTVAGEYEQKGLALACSEPKVIGDVVAQWLAHAAHLKTILFAVNIAHSQALAQAFSDKGIHVETIDHHMGKTEREAIVGRVRSGQTRIICNVGILGEGVDIPDLECAILARPTKSLALYLQQVGRVMRPATGKTGARIHDHGGCVQRHGLLDARRDYTLTATRETQPKLPSLRVCPECFAQFETAPVCPQCGYVFPMREATTIEESDGVAIDIHAKPAKPGGTHAEREAFKEELVRIAIARRMKPGWVIYAFLEKYPEAPRPFGAFREVQDAQRRS